MPQTIVFSNQKGGVGKTTLSRELGVYLAAAGVTVLLIDLDPQANLTQSLTDNPLSGCYGALLENGFEITPLKPSSFDGEEPGSGTLSILAGDIRMATLEKFLIGEIDAYTRLKDLLEHTSFKPFDYILIDSPPSLGVLTINALTAADHLIIPMNPSLYSMQGTNDLLATVGKVKKSLNPSLNLLGVIINAFDSVPVITRQIREEIVSVFEGQVFSTVLSKSIRIEEAIASRDGVVFTVKGKIRDEIMAIGEELVERIRNHRDETTGAGE
jgi:chromosome partitioning protein